MAEWAANLWYVAFWSAAIEPGTLYPRTILDEPVVVFRGADGAVVALEDTCPHRFAPLSRGRIAGDGVVECGYHGLRFDRRGACVSNPHGDGKLPHASVRVYPVVEKHGIVWIWPGQAPPDAAAIPDYGIIDRADPLHVSELDYLRIAAGYRTITDNLLDLSHVPFLHPGALSGSVKDEVRVHSAGDTVDISRWSYDVPVPSVFDMLFRQDGRNVDSWTEMRWMPPGCMILDTGVRAPGTQKESGTGYYGLHLLTPETATSTHYHFAAVRFDVQPRSREDDVEIRAKLSAARRHAFADQDAPMIEAQQRRITAGVTRKPTLLAVDAGAVRVARVLDRLIAVERS